MVDKPSPTEPYVKSDPALAAELRAWAIRMEKGKRAARYYNPVYVALREILSNKAWGNWKNAPRGYPRAIVGRENRDKMLAGLWKRYGRP